MSKNKQQENLSVKENERQFLYLSLYLETQNKVNGLFSSGRLILHPFV